MRHSGWGEKRGSVAPEYFHGRFPFDFAPRQAGAGRAGSPLRFRLQGKLEWAARYEQGKGVGSTVGFGYPIRSAAAAEAGGHAHAQAQAQPAHRRGGRGLRERRRVRFREGAGNGLGNAGRGGDGWFLEAGLIGRGFGLGLGLLSAPFGDIDLRLDGRG